MTLQEIEDQFTPFVVFRNIAGPNESFTPFSCKGIGWAYQANPQIIFQDYPEALKSAKEDLDTISYFLEK